MFEYTITDLDSMKCVTAKGRIDALSSAEIQALFNQLILEGLRILIVDMSGVHYVSSAGLRIFIGTQKELKKVEGEIILAGITQPVIDIFQVSGFTNLFRSVADKNEVPSLLARDNAATGLLSSKTTDIAIDYLEKEAPAGSLFIIGKQDKMAASSYGENDVVAVKSSAMRFGCGLAALGDSYDEYKMLFGESLVINNNFFFYPAVKHSSVDFMLSQQSDPSITYKFLHGFGFNGDYRYLTSFKSETGALELSSLIKSFFAISQANLMGITILAESKGLWGMNIKKPPIIEQQPAKGENIFTSDCFPEWFDFPVEPMYINNLVAATGIAVRNPKLLPPPFRELFSGDNTFHLHGGIFDRAPIGSNLEYFDAEMTRVFNELSVYKIQHLLGQSRFNCGMAGLVELEV
jgi:anti-anti-sigma factor